MLFFYRLLINIVLILSPIIFIFRLCKKKEDFYRFKEKYCFFSEKRKNGNLIWFHGASVGEIQSIIPLIEKFELDNKIHQILLTSNTLSSSKIINKLGFEKVIHQFFPIDNNILTKKFLNYWNPKTVFFIDSEIWPNMINNIKLKKIPLCLINGRITKKTFNRWIMFENFSKEIFKKFDLCLASSNNSKNFLKKLGVKNVKYFGNLKFSQVKNEKIHLNSNIRKFFSKKIIWCASSTHETEEKICGMVHKILKKKIKNLLTIIIPRHINRINSIKEDLENLKLQVYVDKRNNKLNDNTDIFLVNSYGKTKSFYSISNSVFLGGSLIKHGGQNPLEAAKFGCNIFYGPYVHNFKDVYKYLDNAKISKKIKNLNQLKNLLHEKLLIKKNTLNNQKKLEKIGNKILFLTKKNINYLIHNDL